MTNKTMVSAKSIVEFQRFYKQRFGKEISKQEAMERGMKLIQLVKEITKGKKIGEQKDAPLK